jgi:hypothetical protein
VTLLLGPQPHDSPHHRPLIRPPTCISNPSTSFDVALIHTEEGLKIDVYPITDSEAWDGPCDRFEVREEEIRALERELGDG